MSTNRDQQDITAGADQTSHPTSTPDQAGKSSIQGHNAEHDLNHGADEETCNGGGSHDHHLQKVEAVCTEDLLASLAEYSVGPVTDDQRDEYTGIQQSIESTGEMRLVTFPNGQRVLVYPKGAIDESQFV